MNEIKGSTSLEAAALEIKDLSLLIGKSRIIDQVSLSISKGETVGLIGPNGSGKTTLFNCISGFLKPWAGKIYINGFDATASSPSERAHLGIGRVFQNSGVFRDLTLMENLLLALEAQKSPLSSFIPWGSRPRKLRKEAIEILSTINLADKADKPASSLSGGQLRLLEIVRSVAFGAEIFLLDEPTAGVSPKMKEGVSDLIKNLQKLGKTILIIEHDMNFIQAFCKRIAVLDGGRVALDDTPENVRGDKTLQQIYFGNGS